MADKTPDQLTAATTVADTDLLIIYPLPSGPMKKLEYQVLLDLIVDDLGSAVLVAANNLSDVASVTSARANMGLGTVATLSASAVFQVSNNLSEVANAATARTNIGAAASNAPTITGGMTFSGSSKGNVQAVGALDIDVSIAEAFTKSIATNSTFTFSNPVASKFQAFALRLTITSAAVPTWPASVEWASSLTPTLGNGVHILGFFTFNGGTDWTGVVIAKNVG
jgi:hypothetical protein